MANVEHRNNREVSATRWAAVDLAPGDPGWHGLAGTSKRRHERIPHPFCYDGGSARVRNEALCGIPREHDPVRREGRLRRACAVDYDIRQDDLPATRAFTKMECTF